MKFQKITLVLSVLCMIYSANASSQASKKANIAVIQASGSPTQDPFMEDYDPAKVRPLTEAHMDKLLGLFEKAGKMGADLVCGPEDMQRIGSYGLYIETIDPESGKILADALAVPVPGALTDRISKIAEEYNMYVLAPIYELYGDKVYNTTVVFDREGKIMGKHRKTIIPIMETWLVSVGDEYEVYETDFGNIAIATCWEIFYPEISTIYALKGADIIFNPTMAKDNQNGQSLSTAHKFITRATDNSVYIAPVVLGTDGNGIIDFEGNVMAEAIGEENTVIMTEIDFSKERLNSSTWWKTINGTDNVTAIHFKSRRPELFKMISDPHPPILEKYKDVQLTTGDRERQIKAVREVDYGPKKQ